MIFKSRFPDIEIPKIGVYQYITSNPSGIDDEKLIFVDAITNKKLPFGEFKRDTKRFAAGLIHKVGFKRGDVLAIFSLNHLDYSTAVFGAIAAGGKVTPINPSYKVNEFTHQLKDSDASVVIVNPLLLSIAIEGAAAANFPKTKIFLFGEEEINGIQPFWSFISDQEIIPVEFTPEEAKSTTAYLCYSSGTTGKNKGVETTHTNIVSNLAQISAFEKGFTNQTSLIGFLVLKVLNSFNPDTKSFISTRMFCIKGASCVILPKFELELFCCVIQDYKVNLATLVPPVVLLLVKNPIAKKYDLSSLQLAISAAAPLSKELSNDFTKIHKIPIKQAYGLTETSPITHLAMTDNIVNGSIGILIPNVECKIVSVDGQELGYNEPGEFYVRGPNGYLNNKVSTDMCIDKDGWFHTGDIGFADPQGNFFIIDRGFQVAPAELESVLIIHPLIDDAAVVGVYSNDGVTEYPAAFVVLKTNIIQSDQIKEEIKEFVSQRVADHKRLRGGVYFIDQIPKSPSGKILRRLLRDRVKHMYISKL
ncbi:9768_t:CDS:10 [Funneliformis mosseae]|uniref:9768_t:CDS:1 n=1 Tax=Funneliformis mosseae TaxID=27381 RepID=A0A9N9CE87_FUNMO|nr:9768_t:CDS:10 [Funneliformis mosseae]